MRSKHRYGVILLGGWILVRPFVTIDGVTSGNVSEYQDRAAIVKAAEEGRVKIATDRPLSEWQQVSVHDTATDCDRARAAEKNHPLYAQTRCVPAEHIYPPKK